MECVVISSDEEDSEDEKFKADLELAKRLSFQEHVQKKAATTPVSHSAIKSFVRTFKKFKFNPLWGCSSECSSSRDKAQEDHPPRKMIKLEDGQMSATEDRVLVEPVYQEISDDDLPDLEETEIYVRKDRIKEEDGGREDVETNSPESPTPEEQCANPLGLNLEPRRVPLYEEDNDTSYQTISSDSEVKCEESETSVIILSDDEDTKPVKVAASGQEDAALKTPPKFFHHEDSPFKKTVRQDNPSTPESPSVTSSPKVESLFNHDTKRKLADILKRIGSTKSLNNNDSGNSSPHRTSSSSSLCSLASLNERHFSDVLDSGTKRANQTAERKEEVRIKSETAGDDEIAKPNVKLGQPQRRRKIHLRRKSEETASKKDMFCQEISPNRDFSVLEVLKPLRINILPDGIDTTLCQAMSNLHVNTINSCFEEGTDFLDQGLQFIHDYLDSYAIPQSMYKDIVIRGLLKSRDTQRMLKSYKIILLIHEKHPEVLSELDWDFLKLFMEELSIGRGLWNQEPLILQMVGLFLKVMIRSFEEELYSINVKDLKTIRQTNVFRTLSYDSGYINLKELVNWIRCSVTSGEYPEVQDTVYLGHLEPNVDLEGMHLQRQEVSKILPLLQKLLSLGISVSSSPLECAKVISSELLKTYIYLTSVKHKSLLIETISSNVLRFRLISLVLLNHCEEAFPVDFPQDLQSIYECYYSALPPRYSPLTPPTTPQSDEENDNTGPRIEHYSPVQVEELAMLLYYVTQSYLQCTKRKGHNVLRRKCIMTKRDLNSLSKDDECDLQQLPAQVEQLRGHLLTLTSDLTEPTNLYLNLMTCLS